MSFFNLPNVNYCYCFQLISLILILLKVFELSNFKLLKNSAILVIEIEFKKWQMQIPCHILHFLYSVDLEEVKGKSSVNIM